VENLQDWKGYATAGKVKKSEQALQSL